MTRRSKMNATPIDLLIGRFKKEFANKIKTALKSTKRDFSYENAVDKCDFTQEVTDRDSVMIDFIGFIESNPLKDNDFWKYGQAYKNGTKLDEKYFRYDLDFRVKQLETGHLLLTNAEVKRILSTSQYLS